MHIKFSLRYFLYTTFLNCINCLKKELRNAYTKEMLSANISVDFVSLPDYRGWWESWLRIGRYCGVGRNEITTFLNFQTQLGQGDKRHCLGSFWREIDVYLSAAYLHVKTVTTVETKEYGNVNIAAKSQSLLHSVKKDGYRCKSIQGLRWKWE